MGREPKAALESADAAHALEPGRAAPLIVRARALLRLGRVEKSLGAFTAASALDRHSVNSPLVLWDLATAQRRAGNLGEARASYRRLVPLATLLPRAEDRVTVLLEAAHTTMASEGAAETGPPRFEETLEYLRQAMQEARGSSRLDAALSLALALDRAGQRERADALLGEAKSAATWVRRTAASYVANPKDAVALAALSLENTAPREALAAYEKFLAAPPSQDAFVKSAKERAARLEGSAKRDGGVTRR